VRFSAEAAVRAAPEVIVLCGVDPPKDRAPLTGLERTRIATLRSTALLHPGPRLAEALSDLAAALRP
jgi:ABC-type hemin transport system substrate-binding protein